MTGTGVPSGPFCAEVSAGSEESLEATASFVEHWLLIEYRGLWNRQPLVGSSLPEAVKAHISEQLRVLPRARLLFIRRPERRREPTLACYFGASRERERRFFELELGRYEDLLEVDLAAAMTGLGSLQEPVFAVCTHGKRDRCCARYGQPLYEELRARCGDRVWQSTHVGGDRFAGNLVILPEGLYFGRVGRADVGPLVDDYLAGRVYLDCFRGRSCHPFAVQAAERRVRAETGLDGIDEVRVVSHEREGESWRVRLTAGEAAEAHEVDVAVERGASVYLTCDSLRPEHPLRFRTTAHRIVPG